MKFGIFLPTTNDGYILSRAVPSFLPTVAMNTAVAATAEEVGFDFLLAMSKFRGYGGGTGFWDYSLDPMGLTGALIGATSRVELWGSVAAPTLHPAMAARTAATFDEASGGRFVLNVVAGWNAQEYAQMGLWPEGYYESRYRYSREYIEVVRELWSTGRCDRRSEFFQLDDCRVQPLPPHGVRVVVPGQSRNSLTIAAEAGDFNFVMGDFAAVTRSRAELLDACAATGRTVDSAALYGVITAATDEEALEQFREICRQTDYDSAHELQTAASADAHGTAVQRLKGLSDEVPDLELTDDRALVVFHPSVFHPHLVGSYERVARFFRDLEAQAGVVRAVLSFPDFERDVERFGREVLPLVNPTLVPA